MPAAHMAANIEAAALLGVAEQAGLAVLTLTEYLEPEELLRSRLTREEVTRQLRILADSFAALPATVRPCLGEIDFDAWAALRRELGDAASVDSALVFGVQSLVPAALLWLRVARREQPGLFAMRA